MTISEILKELEPYTGKVPMKAMRAAVEQREAVTPELLRVVETVAENPQVYAGRDDYQVHFFGWSGGHPFTPRTPDLKRNYSRSTSPYRLRRPLRRNPTTFRHNHL